jgi:uncharacterized membrane protein
VAVEASGAAAPEAVGNIMSLFSSTPVIDHAKVVAAIAAAESRTSGEIRILVAREKAEEPVLAAEKHFERLGMTRTAARNGVLIFLAPKSHTFAIVGDTGVHARCGEAFWQNVAASMEQHFRSGEFTDGLVNGVQRAGDLLAEHFPRDPGDKNELPNHIEEH